MKKVVITGGLGYVGMELAKIYSGKTNHYHVLVLDNVFYSVKMLDNTFRTLQSIEVFDVSQIDLFSGSFSDQVVEGYEQLAYMLYRIGKVSEFWLGGFDTTPTQQIFNAVKQTAVTSRAIKRHFFGGAGVVVAVVKDLLEAYNETYEALEDFSSSPKNLAIKLDNFASALAMDSKTFTVRNEKLNFTINVAVQLDAEKAVDMMADYTIMGARTLKTVGTHPFDP